MPLLRIARGLMRPRLNVPAVVPEPPIVKRIMTAIDDLKEIKLQDLKLKTPAELVSLAEELEVENASALRKQELLFAILKNFAVRDVEIIGEGVVEVLQDGRVGGLYSVIVLGQGR